MITNPHEEYVFFYDPSICSRLTLTFMKKYIKPNLKAEIIETSQMLTGSQETHIR